MNQATKSKHPVFNLKINISSVNLKILRLFSPLSTFAFLIEKKRETRFRRKKAKRGKRKKAKRKKKEKMKENGRG